MTLSAGIDVGTGAVKAGYRIGKHAPGERRYSVDHDTGFRLIDPEGRMLALLPGPHQPFLAWPGGQCGGSAKAGAPAVTARATWRRSWRNSATTARG